MADKRLQDFYRQTLAEILKGMTTEERLEGVPLDARLKGLSVEEIVRALRPEVLEDLLKLLKANGSLASPQ